MDRGKNCLRGHEKNRKIAVSRSTDPSNYSDLSISDQGARQIFRLKFPYNETQEDQKTIDLIAKVHAATHIQFLFSVSLEGKGSIKAFPE